MSADKTAPSFAFAFLYGKDARNGDPFSGDDEDFLNTDVVFTRLIISLLVVRPLYTRFESDSDKAVNVGVDCSILKKLATANLLTQVDENCFNQRRRAR